MPKKPLQLYAPRFLTRIDRPGSLFPWSQNLANKPEARECTRKGLLYEDQSRKADPTAFIKIPMLELKKPELVEYALREHGITLDPDLPINDMRRMINQREKAADKQE